MFFKDFINSIDPDLSDAKEIGERVLKFVEDFEGAQYVRPINGFP